MAYVPYYEYIVIGCGGVGSAAVYWLSKRAGKGVLGLEQFKLGHDNGGSQDHSRIIRLCYHDPRYTKIVRDTYKAWEEVERESGLQLVYKTGGLDFTLKGGPQEWLMEEYAKAMDAQNIPYERLDGPEIRRRFPQFEVGAETVGLYQADTGLVDAARGNSTHIQLALAHGATVMDECAVLGIDRMKSGMTMVRTSKGEFRCRRVVVTAGAWINHVLRSVGAHIPVAVTQEQVTYFATPHVKEFTKDRQSLGPIMYSKTCLYTMTMDRHFVIDTLASKGWSDVIVCCGAGHAYKFASLLGKILSELAIDGRTQYPIAEFTMNRPAVTDPNFKPVFYMGKAKPPPAKL
uniref:FAD dependent oxidoreductase domain-containing protein n=1 Tax=Branchiostoma floridae TaxID=7739 RepID=C3ZB43_BRAFL|eukprot:XP_002594069.1 hypothetical protein BRAFLDRAFT_68491 [Branchiostoma floridae]